MEPRHLLSSTKATAYTSLPLLVSYKSSSFEKPQLGCKSYLSFRTVEGEQSEFLGKRLVLPEKINYLGNMRKVRVPFEPVKPAGKRRKDLAFESVIRRDKKLKSALKIRKILVRQPDGIMSLRQLGKFRRELGVTKTGMFIALLKKFPAVFDIIEEGVSSLRFRLTPEAERLYLEELKVKSEMEDLLVSKLRKLLMMSLEKRILLEKMAHLRSDFGLPLEFRDTICHRYPQYFRVVATGRGPALKLTHWDPKLAVSAAELAEEEIRARELKEKKLIIDGPLKFNKIKLPKGLNLSKREMQKISQFRDMPYISPYSDFSDLKLGTREKEMHACGVVHEILSLTVEKRILVEDLIQFREEFRFSQQLREMLIRHPDLFYVSLQVDGDSVFLRESYGDSKLIDKKDRLFVVRKKFCDLVSVPRFPRRNAPRKDNDSADEIDEPEDQSDKDGKGWSDIHDYI